MKSVPLVAMLCCLLLAAPSLAFQVTLKKASTVRAQPTVSVTRSELAPPPGLAPPANVDVPVFGYPAQQQIGSGASVGIAGYCLISDKSP